MRTRKTWIMISVVAIAIVLFVTLVIFRPGVPKRIVLLTGPRNSAYHDLGLRFAEDLRNRGLEVDVIATKGSLDNVRRLEKSGNVVAFAPSAGIWNSGNGNDPSELVALGSIGIEPLWLFYRADLQIARIADLSGKTVVTEGKGSASDAAGRKLIEISRLTDEVSLRPLADITGDSLIEAFVEKSIDAIFISGTATSPVVEALLGADAANFLSIERAEACAARISGVMAVVAPEGVFDLARNVPPTDAQLLATTTSLIAHKDLHPAVVPMLLVTAERVGEKETSFSTKISFPSADHVTLPLAPSARRYFKQGEAGLSQFLPYRVTRLLNHLGFFVLPILAVVILLLRFVPVSLRMWGAFQLKGLFKQLESVEKRYAAGDDATGLVAELDRIDRASANMSMPRSIVHDYVDFRQFLHDMRERIGAHVDDLPSSN